MNSRLARFFGCLALCLTSAGHSLIWGPILPSLAQATSSDRNRPSMMTVNQIVGAQHGEGGDAYYQFNAGPGEVVLTADGKTDFYGATMEVNCFDLRGNPITRLSLAATNTLRATTTKFQLFSGQPVLMQVRFYKDDKVRNFLYRITLTGSVQLRNVTDSEQALPTNTLMQPDRLAGVRKQNYWGDPRRMQQMQILQRKAQQAQMARASRNNKYSRIPISVPPYLTSVYQPPLATPVSDATLTQSSAQVLVQAPVQSPVQSPAQAPPSPQSTQVQSSKVLIQDSTSTSLEETPIDDKWALVVGVSKFSNSGIDLKYPAKDAKDFRDYLINEANFKPDHVKLLVNEEATKERVLTELGDKWLPKRAHPNDLVVVYLSTHGSPSNLDGEGVNYLVMHNTDPQRLYATGLSVQDLAFALKSRVHAKRSVLIMDACHSGSAEAVKGLKRDGNVNLDAFPIGTGQMVICSSKPDQVSWESKRYDNGVFTAQLLKALRTNNKSTLGDAFKRMQDNVESEVLKDRGHVQTPVLKTRWQGRELVLTIPPARPHSDSEQ